MHYICRSCPCPSDRAFAFSRIPFRATIIFLPLAAPPSEPPRAPSFPALLCSVRWIDRGNPNLLLLASPSSSASASVPLTHHHSFTPSSRSPEQLRFSTAGASLRRRRDRRGAVGLWIQLTGTSDQQVVGVSPTPRIAGSGRVEYSGVGLQAIRASSS